MSIEQALVSAVSAVAGGAAAWASLQARVRRLEEITADLKAEKASKEALSVVASSVDRLTQEMERRFDRLEDLLKAIIARPQ
jgi:HAMP domain-containing protein